MVSDVIDGGEQQDDGKYQALVTLWTMEGPVAATAHSYVKVSDPAMQRRLYSHSYQPAPRGPLPWLTYSVL